MLAARLAVAVLCGGLAWAPWWRFRVPDAPDGLAVGLDVAVSLWDVGPVWRWIWLGMVGVGLLSVVVGRGLDLVAIGGLTVAFICLSYLSPPGLTERAIAPTVVTHGWGWWATVSVLIAGILWTMLAPRRTRPSTDEHG